MSEKTVFRINVRAFAEYLFQEGDLGLPLPAGRSAELGRRVHLKLQGRGVEGYRAEVELTHIFPGEKLDLELSGRADGIYEKDGSIHLEEIKSTVRDSTKLRPIPVHTAQLELYGWLYCLEKGVRAVVLDLVYVHRLTSDERVFSTTKTVAELEATYGKAVADFLAWLDGHELYRQNLRDELAALSFPFPDFRSGQQDAAEAVFRTIRDGGILFLQAPTGIGKTMATLYAALKAQGRGYGGKVFYLTAKNAGAAAAEAAIDSLSSKLPHLRSLSLTAKSKICFRTDETGEGRPPCLNCPYGIDYFAKAKRALGELFNHTRFTRARIEELARKYEACPFELSLDLSLYCDVIVGDYNYAFDYGAKLQRFFTRGKTDFVFLVDEAHNLVDRARAMFSGTLSKRRVLEARRSASPAERKILSALNAVLLEAKKTYPLNYEAAQEKAGEGISAAVGKTQEGLDDLIDRGSLSEDLFDFYWELRRLRTVLDNYDGSYRTIVTNRGADFRLDFLCIDPSPQLSLVLRDQRAAVFFSGTLTPASYFAKLLAGDLERQRLELPSPFPPEHFTVTARPVSTRWADRGRNLGRYADLVRETFEKEAGNLIVFSPSFAFQTTLLARLLDGAEPPSEWIIQRPNMSEADKDAFISSFDGRGLRGFAVTGGSFAESIDLSGERLVGVLVFGLGLPQVNVVNDTYRDWFEVKFGDGFDWAYTYPGLNRVIQAAGRVIRSETDRGFLCLVDDRYAGDGYLRLLPEWWDVRVIREPTV